MLILVRPSPTKFLLALQEVAVTMNLLLGVQEVISTPPHLETWLESSVVPRGPLLLAAQEVVTAYLLLGSQEVIMELEMTMVMNTMMTMELEMNRLNFRIASRRLNLKRAMMMD